jgi:hypothetical protein
MGKRIKENKSDFLSFPYKCYWDSEEYKNRKSGSLDITDERIKYYQALYKRFFPNEFSHLYLGVRYFPLIPLRLMVEIYESKARLDSVAPFFLDPSKDNVLQEPYAESLSRDFEFMLSEIECFYQVYGSLAFRCDQPYPIQIQALRLDFEWYLHSLERIADEAALDALYDAQRCTGPLFDALADKAIRKEQKASFRENMASLRACIERIERALYKLEAFCFAKIKMPKPVKHDLKRDISRRRIGSGRKGKRTERMENQLAEFKAWLRDHPIDERKKGCKVGELAHQFWLFHKLTFDKDASRDGEKRGFKCSKILAAAYRNSKK